MAMQQGNRVWRVVLMILTTVATATAADDDKDNFSELFNGRDLAGWKVKGDEGGFWKVGTATIDPNDPRELVVDPAGHELINTHRGGRDLYSRERVRRRDDRAGSHGSPRLELRHLHHGRIRDPGLRQFRP